MLGDAGDPVPLAGEDSITMKTFALISHDHNKVDLLAWANCNRATLQRFRNVPLDTNLAAADLIIAGLVDGEGQETAARLGWVG